MGQFFQQTTRNLRVSFIEQFFHIPQFVFPEQHHHFQPRYAPDTPSDFYRRVLGVFCDF